MRVCVYLSYIGLGANLLHLSYCHQIAKKYGPITIITLCENLKSALDDDPYIDRVIVLSFNDLPEAARRYIATRAARVFHDRVVGSGELHRFFQVDEQMAWTELLEYESEVGDYTIFDDYDVFRVIENVKIYV